MLSSSNAHALLESCTVSAVAASFGSYSPFAAAPLDTVGRVDVTCRVILLAVMVGYTITLSEGGSGSFAERRMSAGSHPLSYNLYANAARTNVWGNGSDGTSAASFWGLLGVGDHVMSYSVYGRISAGQNVAPGVYSDLVVVTVNY